MYTVYVIRGDSGLIYIGHTQDLAKRLVEHRQGKSKWTKRDKGWEVLHREEYSTRAEAMRREKWLKSGVGREWLQKKLGSLRS